MEASPCSLAVWRMRGSRAWVSRNSDLTLTCITSSHSFSWMCSNGDRVPSRPALNSTPSRRPNCWAKVSAMPR
ncbi:hypothetical protein D3C72_1389380 [compost metagenome]